MLERSFVGLDQQRFLNKVLCIMKAEFPYTYKVLQSLKKNLLGQKLSLYGWP